jgi:hypothetical protein
MEQQKRETPAWQGRRSIDLAQAGSSGTSEDNTAEPLDQGGNADSLRIIRIHWGLDGPAPFRQVGNVAIDVLASLDRKLARQAPMRLSELVS